MILTIYFALVRAHLDYYIQLWGPQYRRDMALLECIHRRATKMMQTMECLPCKDRLRELGLCSLEKRRLRGDLIATFQYLKGKYRKEGDRLFSWVCGDRTRGNGFKLREGRFCKDIKKKSYTVRVVRHCDRLPSHVVNVLSLETFKARLDQALGNLT